MKIPQLVERKFLRTFDQPVTAPLYEIVIARNGTFKRAKRREMTAGIELLAFNAMIPELAEGRSSIAITRRIPAAIFKAILEHARRSTDPERFTENLYAVGWDEFEGRYYWDEVSRERSFARTIADDENPAYRQALLEIHTHPPGCTRFSAADDRDEGGKFRLFGILVDIFSATPSLRLRIGIYDTFWEIPVDLVTDASVENIFDLVRREWEELAAIRELFADYQVPVPEPICQSL